MNKNIITISVSALLLTACSTSYHTLKDTTPAKVPTVKNVILMIGDGMGPQQVGLLEEYARRAPNSTYNNTGNITALSKFAHAGHMGLSLNAPYGENGKLVNDSACSATQLATGKASGSEMIGLDEHGNIVETILEKAKKAGKATGLVSDTRITHATPAAFASHQPHRSYEAEIAAEMVSSGMVDVMLSGGARVFIPAGISENTTAQRVMANLGAPASIYKKSNRKDNRNIFVEAKEQHGYTLAFDKHQMQTTQASKLLGLFANSGMDNGIAYKACKASNNCSQPSLKEMTIKALEILSKDENGFFLMIEGGQIDWAGHANDAGWMLSELLKFDEAAEAVYQWVKERDDTLVVITADHETGSFGFSYSRKNIPQPQHLEGNGMQGTLHKPNFNFGQLSHLDKLYAQTGTFFDMMNAASAQWDFTATTPEDWMAAVNKYSQYKIDINQANKIGERETNEYYKADHSYQNKKTVPHFADFKEFYVYADDDHSAKIARALAGDQNVVWGTGTHTSTPVPVYAFGPDAITKQFSTMSHHIEVAQKMITALGLEE